MFQKILSNLAGRKYVPATAEDFYNAISAAMPVPKGDIVIGDMLSRYTPEEYALMKLFLSPDRQSGYALKNGDELVSVFSIPGGRGRDIAAEAVLGGARRLDNYDVRGKLPGLYGSVGFEEVGRYPFNPEYATNLSANAQDLAPDFVEMVMSPRVSSELGRLRGAGIEDLNRIVAGGTGRLSRRKDVQNTAGLAALLTMLAAGSEER